MNAPARTVDMAAIKTDHGMVQAKAETVAFAAARLSHGVSYKQGHRTGWWEAVQWLLTAQGGLDDLTVGELVAELGKGAGSIYWPIKEEDPSLWGDCVRCDRTTLFTADGCVHCGATS